MRPVGRTHSGIVPPARAELPLAEVGGRDVAAEEGGACGVFWGKLRRGGAQRLCFGAVWTGGGRARIVGWGHAGWGVVGVT